jgi:RNA polymerase sigma-70 factor, ECF subfamily
MSLTKISARESTESDDRTLVVEFRRTRRAEAFEALFERYGKRLYCFAYKFHRRVDLAEDCVQETFRRAIQQIDHFGEKNREWNFWGWLVTIARDVCLSEWRRGQTRMKYAQATASVETTRTALTPEQQVMIAEARKMIRSLPYQWRACYLLFFVEGYTYKEVSRITGYEEKTVKTSIQTAKRHIDRAFRQSSGSNESIKPAPRTSSAVRRSHSAGGAHWKKIWTIFSGESEESVRVTMCFGTTVEAHWRLMLMA